MDDELYPTVELGYTIHKYSSYSASYVPENIMVNNPTDQLSRWFTDTTSPSQYIMLKLTQPAIVETIKFGKYIKPHVSDLKKFQIFGGTDEDNLSLLLSGGLKKDRSAETFRLRHRTIEGFYLPVIYIRIVPLQSWGPAYNYTIWFVELQGKTHPDLVNYALDTINLRKEEEAVRILLKHLRRRRYKDAFEALSRESGVQLEGAVQARLFTALVENGDFKLAEQILEEAMAEGEFSWYLSWQPYTPEWRQLSPCSSGVEAALCTEGPAHVTHGLIPVPNGMCGERSCEAGVCSNVPGPRGGHQLVVDPASGTLYLFGGWNGIEDLDDLWSFDTTAERWSLLCRHAVEVGGPSPRSCHKMVLDPVQRKLYTLGRYLDNVQRVPANMNSDLFSYDLDTNEWELICHDTASAGGPRLVFDHQMCIDPDTQTIYVFGGRVLPANTEEVVSPQYSGLYAYYASRNTWDLLLDDGHHLSAPLPRVSHSMLFHPVQRRLYMFAGQRNKEHLLDLWWWDVSSNECGALCRATARSPPPAAGFTQRATIDPDADEVFVLSGMSKEKDKRVQNALWVYSMSRRCWACAYRSAAGAAGETGETGAPVPRYAHQLVYDPLRKVHYLFGGNPGSQACPRLRLDDLWQLTLHKPTPEQVLNSVRWSLREACFKEMCAMGNDVRALRYLRNEVSAALDQDNQEQVRRFQKLATLLFASHRVGREQPALALDPRRARSLARRRHHAAPQGDLAHALAEVLGADDISPEPPHPYEAVSPPSPAPAPDTWDVGEDADEHPLTPEWVMRAARLRLYDTLCGYFRPSVVPPPGDIDDLVKL